MSGADAPAARPPATLPALADPPGAGVLRVALLAHAQALDAAGLGRGTSGNLSVRCGTGFLITPSGLPFATLSPADLVWLDAQGRFDHPLRPSSEWQLHRDLYRARPEFDAIVHAHPPASTALATTRRGIPPLHYMVVAAGGDDIRCAEYATFGTPALSAAALHAMAGRSACLLANHGMLAAADSLPRALWLAGEVEALADSYLRALQVGGPVLLSAAELADVRQQFRDYGLRNRPAATAAAGPVPAAGVSLHAGQ